jgi:hypothetical protein
MQRWELGQLGLEEEFKKLGHVLEQSLKSSLKISRHFLRSGLKRFWSFLWFFLEEPQLWKKIGPDKKRKLQRSKRFDEIRPFIHPPSQHF